MSAAYKEIKSPTGRMIRIGQVWECMDSRGVRKWNTTRKKVVAINKPHPMSPVFITLENLATQRKSQINLRRFWLGSTGYRFVSER